MNVLITGGASNIAYQVALKLSMDNKVYLTVHTLSQLNKLKQSISKDNIECFKLDINDEADYEQLNNLDIDLFIANASIGCGGSVLAMDIDVLRRNYETNIFANFKLIKYVYKKMDSKGGKIFIMSSLASMLPITMLDAYVSSKAAISMITLCLQKELKCINSQVKISLIEPGAFYTGFNQVMIDNKENNLDKDTIMYSYYDKFDKRQKRLFKLIESKNVDKIVNKIVKQAYKKKPKSKIRAPFLQLVFTKLYIFLFR